MGSEEVSERLTDVELLDIELRHEQIGYVSGHCSRCCGCEDTGPCWPCDAARLLAELGALKDEMEAAEQRGYERALAEVERVRCSWTDIKCIRVWSHDESDVRPYTVMILRHIRSECCCPKEPQRG